MHALIINDPNHLAITHGPFGDSSIIACKPLVGPTSLLENDAFIIISYRPSDHETPYATHVMTVDGKCIWGHYFDNWYDTILDFNARS